MNTLRNTLQVNESATTLIWLCQQLGVTAFGYENESETDTDSVTGVTEAWADLTARMRRPAQQFMYATDWISDPWLARGLRDDPIGGVTPTWSPPDAIHEWPVNKARELISPLIDRTARTKQQNIEIKAHPVPKEATGEWYEAVAAFMHNEYGIEVHGDANMVRGEHVRSWLLTAVGPLLRALLLSPEATPEVLRQAVADRVGFAVNYPKPDSWIDDFGTRSCDVLYNATSSVDGFNTLDLVDIRVGQGEPWREAWAWLSVDIPPADLRAAVQLAARVMRSASVVNGLQALVHSYDDSLRIVSLCVLRRWLLTLQAMAWLETAALRRWEYLRTQDLACFAFNAVKPDWPRRLVALSHRSSDVKPSIIGTPIWKSARCAVDANYIPSWETNTGMIWGLFAATPAIIRIDSQHYRSSIWCQREYEVIDHLLNAEDFMQDRCVADVEIVHLPTVTTLTSVTHAATRSRMQPVLPEFPPLLTVWSPGPSTPMASAVLAAAGALRALNLVVGNPTLTNDVAFALSERGDAPLPVVFNNPEGWRDAALIFRRLRRLSREPGNQLPLRLPSGYSAADMAADFELFQRVPDLSSGETTLQEALTAAEFLRSVWPADIDEGFGRFLALNVQSVTRHAFRSDPWSLHRGLLAIRTPVPIWLIQRAGQDVDLWQLPGDRPIFTEYASNQFGWMVEARRDSAQVVAAVFKNSGLEASTGLIGVNLE